MKNIRNTVQLIGNLGGDPEFKKLEGGSTLAKFSLATSDKYTNQDGEKVENTTWHNCIAWGKTAEIAEQFLQKGDEVVVEGKLTNRSYENKEGVKKYITEVVLNQIVLVGGKS